MPAVDVFNETHLERICDVLADTSTGLTGSEIGRFLADLGVEDPMPTMTKRHRLYEALLLGNAETAAETLLRHSSIARWTRCDTRARPGISSQSGKS